MKATAQVVAGIITSALLTYMFLLYNIYTFKINIHIIKNDKEYDSLHNPKHYKLCRFNTIDNP